MVVMSANPPSGGSKVMDCKNEGIVKFLVEVVKYDVLNNSSWVVVNSLTGDGCDLRIAFYQTSLQWLRVKGGVVLWGLVQLRIRQPDISDAINPESGAD